MFLGGGGFGVSSLSAIQISSEFQYSRRKDLSDGVFGESLRLMSSRTVLVGSAQHWLGRDLCWWDTGIMGHLKLNQQLHWND